eukprot:TRINITY_DN6389_c0_g2_i1.p1 TRINITY_DN6389_c0_g2~~TRINITY_DN6389_c0_g2_i1.p1  ORF type:complete len:469 (-),score=99.68 TRINITY_DN6389_c0_g2_i1:211-1617(-)
MTTHVMSASCLGSKTLLPFGNTSGASSVRLPQSSAVPFHPRNLRHVGPAQTLESSRTSRLRVKMFDDVEDDREAEGGELMGQGKQDFLEPRPPTDPTSDLGYLLFPKKFNPEIASLGLYIREDVRRCCCLVKGGVFENLLFFPVIQFLKDRYPGVRIDVISSKRGKQTYELNKNVRRAWVYDLDDQYSSPVEWTETLGKIKNENYDLVLSTRPAGIGMSVFLWLTDARQRISYVIPNVNGVGSGIFLSGSVTAPAANLSELGYNMYAELLAYLDQPGKGVVSTGVTPPLEVGILRAVRDAAEAKLKDAGVESGKYVLVHGLESKSVASMQPSGDSDSLLPLSTWTSIIPSGTKALYVIASETDREAAEAAFGSDASIALFTTPGQLAAAIEASVGVISTNTAALQLAIALEKPSVGLFGSAEKAAKFVPNAELKNVTIVSSGTGKLADIKTQDALSALTAIAKESVLV